MPQNTLIYEMAREPLKAILEARSLLPSSIALGIQSVGFVAITAND